MTDTVRFFTYAEVLRADTVAFRHSPECNATDGDADEGCEPMVIRVGSVEWRIVGEDHDGVVCRREEGGA